MIHKPKIVAILQARMGSTRLPNKTMTDICGKPLLERIIERVKTCQTIDELIVATTTETEDEKIVSFCRSINIKSFQGSKNDVLDRFYEAANITKAETIVRITADDPFKDPHVIDFAVDYILTRPKLDYVSNTIKPTYPEGLDTEVFTYFALEKTWKEAKLLSEREHVTPYIWKNPHIFKIQNIENNQDLSNWRWTLDYPEDLVFTQEIYARLDKSGIFSMNEILNLLEREPKLATINQHIERNVGYRLSLKKDYAKNN